MQGCISIEQRDALKKRSEHGSTLLHACKTSEKDYQMPLQGTAIDSKVAGFKAGKEFSGKTLPVTDDSLTTPSSSRLKYKTRTAIDFRQL